MINKREYEYWKPLVDEYEKEDIRLSKIKGKSICPFCSGSKTVPFIKANVSQDCNECDSNGNITNRKLVEYELI